MVSRPLLKTIVLGNSSVQGQDAPVGSTRLLKRKCRDDARKPYGGVVATALGVFVTLAIWSATFALCNVPSGTFGIQATSIGATLPPAEFTKLECHAAPPALVHVSSFGPGASAAASFKSTKNLLYKL